MPIPVLIDCDPGYDDVIAIVLALASPEVEVLGITTVEGNQPVAETTENALRVVEFLAREIPVAAGANRPFVRELPFRRTPSTVDADVRRDIPGLPPATRRAVDEHAVDLLARVLLAADEPVTLVPIGPLTNVALLLARYPDAAERIGRMVLMGGAIGEGNVTTAAEFNIYVDPESAQRVFSSGIDLTMVGLDVTYRAIPRSWRSCAASAAPAASSPRSSTRFRPTAATRGIRRGTRCTTRSRWPSSCARGS